MQEPMNLAHSQRVQKNIDRTNSGN